MPLVYAVILAAGYSRRMGSDKLSMDLCGKAVLQHSIDQVIKSGVSRVLVVIREAEQAERYTKTENVRFVINREAQVGMSSSIRAALGVLDSEPDAVLIVNGDMPFYGTANYARLISLWEETDQGIAASYYMNEIRNPVIFSARFFGDITTIEGDRGAKEIVQKNLSEVKFMEILDPNLLVDIDTIEDLEYARSMCNRLVDR